jgi:motility quorum-sensing regulator/GCU-specific mRNA interferase toxin
LEKKKPIYDLEAFQLCCSSISGLNITGTALETAAELGFSRQGIIDLIQSTQRAHFFRSMTSYGDYKVWQDVYYVPSQTVVVYLKFTADAVTEFRVLSFKEKDNA